MAKPIGITARVKDNSRKKFKENEEWRLGKKIGRTKQRWVWDVEPYELNPDTTDMGGCGHWEKI